MKRLFVCCLFLSTTIGCNWNSTPPSELSLAKQIEIEIERGDDFVFNRDYVTANVFYTQAIVLMHDILTNAAPAVPLDPDELDMGSLAYFARARSLHCSKSYVDALTDYSKAWWWEQSYGVPDGYGQAEGRLPHPLPAGYTNEYLRGIIFCRAILFLDMGKPREAINDLNQAMRLNSSNGELYFWRGLAYEAKGEQEKAAADILKAEEFGFLEHDQEYTRAHVLMGDFIRTYVPGSIVTGVLRNPSQGDRD
jgi:tetratricopeptide (TPR) repeat protein